MMLNRDQVELIQQEIDGANTPDGSAACRSLLEQDAEARALEAELRQVTRFLGRVEQRHPPPGLRQAILNALPRQARRADRKSTRLNSSHIQKSRMPSSA